MEDKLGRKIKDYDLVLGMIISRYSDGMRFGVFYEGSVYWENGIKSVPSNIYLIDNPCEKEIEIKNKILKEIEWRTKTKGKIEYLKAKDYIVGHIYETAEGSRFVYLGKGHISGYESTAYRKRKKELDGFLYCIVAWNTDIFPIKSKDFSKMQCLLDLFIATKSKKRFVKDTGRVVDIIDNPCTLRVEYNEWDYRCKEKVVIELYD